MTQTSTNYGKVLYGLLVSPESVNKAAALLREAPQLWETLKSPVVPLIQKQKAIDKIFPGELKSFLCVVCKYGHAELLEEIFQAYQETYNRQKHILTAVLYYVTLPSKEQEEKIKSFLKRTYNTAEVALKFEEDKSLVGGFILRTKDQEFDYSLKGRINALQQKLIWR